MKLEAAERRKLCPLKMCLHLFSASRQTKNANVIEMETSGVRMDADTLQLHLPQLLPLAIGYRKWNGFVKTCSSPSWLFVLVLMSAHLVSDLNPPALNSDLNNM